MISDDYEKTGVTPPLLLRRRFSALFSDNHTEASPEVVAFLATSRKELLL
jgi:hypothetical protein